MKVYEAKAILADIESELYVDLQKENAVRCYLEKTVNISAAYLKSVIGYLLHRLDSERTNKERI